MWLGRLLVNLFGDGETNEPFVFSGNHVPAMLLTYHTFPAPTKISNNLFGLCLCCFKGSNTSSIRFFFRDHEALDFTLDTLMLTLPFITESQDKS